jgi:hypothetical protein
MKTFKSALGVYVVYITERLGFSVRRYKVEDWAANRTKHYITFVVWHPKGKNRLGYLYPSFRWF